MLDVLSEAREAGFLGPGPVEAQLRHAEGFLAVARRQALEADVSPPVRIVDLGSGGGIPGLVVAAAWPEATLVLLEANGRRAAFLRRAVPRLGLERRVTVLEERAEAAGRDPAYRGAFDGLLARSFGRPAVVAECGAPFLEVGGWIVVSEPPAEDAREGEAREGTETPSRWPPSALAEFGLEPGPVVHLGASYQVLRQADPCPDRFPRRNGVPAKKPLF